MSDIGFRVWGVGYIIYGLGTVGFSIEGSRLGLGLRV